MRCRWPRFRPRRARTNSIWSLFHLGSENALVDDMPHPSLLRCIHHRLGLMRHGDGIASEYVHTVYSVERRAERARIVEIEQDRFVALSAQPLYILLLSCTNRLVSELRKLVKTSVPYGSERTQKFPRRAFPRQTLRSVPHPGLGGVVHSATITNCSHLSALGSGSFRPKAVF
jgi:hypothetical protein